MRVFAQYSHKSRRKNQIGAKNGVENRPTSLTFWCDKIEMRFFLRIIFVAGYWRKNFFHRNFCPPELDGDPFSTRCTNTRSFFRKERVNSTRESPSNTFPLGNALGVVLLKNNTYCFCCQKLLILSKIETIGTTNENQVLKQNLIFFLLIYNTKQLQIIP